MAGFRCTGVDFILAAQVLQLLPSMKTLIYSLMNSILSFKSTVQEEQRLSFLSTFLSFDLLHLNFSCSFYYFSFYGFDHSCLDLPYFDVLGLFRFHFLNSNFDVLFDHSFTIFWKFVLLVHKILIRFMDYQN